MVSLAVGFRRFRVGFRGVAGAVFLWKNEGKGEGGGEDGEAGVGDRQRNRQVNFMTRRVCRQLCTL